MKWKQSGYYKFLRRVVQIFTRKMETVWAKPFDETPAIFVCNHDRAYGPIAMCAHFDHYKDIRPWINAPVLSEKETPAYIRADFWWPAGKWYTWILNHTVAYIVALILPPILRGAGCIPVYHDTRVMNTLKDSVQALKEGVDIILFPEHPSGYCQYDSEIVSGFVSIGRLYYRRTKQILNFYPTYICKDEHRITVGAPIAYDPEMTPDDFTKKVSELVEKHFLDCSKSM